MLTGVSSGGRLGRLKIVRLVRSAAGVMVVFGTLALATPVAAQQPVLPVQPVGSDLEQEGTVAGAGSRGRGRLTFVREIDLKLGPFFVTPGVGAGAGFESIAGLGTVGGLELDARFFVDAGPSLDVVLPIGQRHVLSGSGEALYRQFAGELRGEQRSRLSGWQFAGTAGYQYSSERFGATATYDVVRAQRGPLEFIAHGGASELTDVDERIDVLSRTAGANLRFAIGQRSSLGIRGAYRDVSYDPNALVGDFELSRELNRSETNLHLSLDRQMTQRTRLGLFASARRSDFTNSASFRDNDRMRAGVRAVFGNRGQMLLSSAGAVGGAEPIEGVVQVGTEILQLEDQQRDDFTGVFAEGTVRLKVHPRLGLWLAGEVRTIPTFWEANVYAVNEGVGTGVDVWVVRGLNVGGFIDYSRVRFPEPASFTQDDGSVLTDQRADSLLVYRGVLRFRLFGLSLALHGGYFERDSNFDIARSRGYFLRLGLGANFSVSESL